MESLRIVQTSNRRLSLTADRSHSMILAMFGSMLITDSSQCSAPDTRRLFGNLAVNWGLCEQKNLG